MSRDRWLSGANKRASVIHRERTDEFSKKGRQPTPDLMLHNRLQFITAPETVVKVREGFEA